MIHFDWKLGPPAKASWGSAEGAEASCFDEVPLEMVTIDRTWELWYDWYVDSKKLHQSPKPESNKLR